MIEPELLGGWYWWGVAYEFGVLALMVVLIVAELWRGDAACQPAEPLPTDEDSGTLSHT